jgi:hypothetical protein
LNNSPQIDDVHDEENDLDYAENDHRQWRREECHLRLVGSIFKMRLQVWGNGTDYVRFFYE